MESLTIGFELNTLIDHSTKKANIIKGVKDLYLKITTHERAQKIS
jgi:hypothetical protein